MANAELSPLFDSSLTFSATFLQLATNPAPDRFHLLVRLLDFLTTPETPDIPKSQEEWTAARMKAEWCLWEGYSEWDIAMNPFLGHFVEVWESRHAVQQIRGDMLVVGIILSGKAKDVLFPYCGIDGSLRTLSLPMYSTRYLLWKFWSRVFR